MTGQLELITGHVRKDVKWSMRSYTDWVPNNQVLLFDGDCAFCSTSMRILLKVMKHPPKVQPYQWADLEKLGLSKEKCAEAVQYIGNDNSRFSGSEAFAAFFTNAGLPWKLLGQLMRVPVIRTLSRFVYSWVARNRYKLPGGTPACRMPETN